MIEVQSTDIAGVKLLVPAVRGDERGFFSEVFNARDLAAAGIELDFVQDNHSFSAQAGVLRGLHFQRPPHAQDKLVRVARGRIYDVAVDLRSDSATFGAHVGVVLSRENWRQLLVPAGFAHGFVTLAPDTEVLYKVTAHYAAEHEGGIHFADPELAIDWPYEPASVTITERDAAWPALAEFQPNNPF